MHTQAPQAHTTGPFRQPIGAALCTTLALIGSGMHTESGVRLASFAQIIYLRKRLAQTTLSKDAVQVELLDIIECSDCSSNPPLIHPTYSPNNLKD